MTKREKEKAAASVRQSFEEHGQASFSVTWVKNRTWGYVAALYFGAWKLDHASGCGYAKDIAMLESALKILTGVSCSAGGFDLAHCTAYIKTEQGYTPDREFFSSRYELTATTGPMEIHCTLRRKEAK